MSDHEKRAEILSKQYEFWMGIKSALGMAPSALAHLHHV